MRNLNIFKNIRNVALIGAALAFSSCFVTSCKDDDEVDNGPAYFTIEDFDQYEMTYAGRDNTTFSNGDRMTVRANGKWQFVPEDEEASAWMQIFPMEGVDDGYIRIFAEENTSAYKRSARYRVLLNGVEQPDILEIVQQNSQPTLNIDTKALTFKRAGGELSVNVTSNIDWECSIEGEDAAVFSAQKIENLAVVNCPDANTSGRELNATLVIKGTGEYANLVQEVMLTQLDATFFENFDWLKSTAGIKGWKIDSGQSETRIDKWSAEEKAHGWTSISTWVYSRTGFLKFGKGKYGGDLASPAVEALGNSSDVTISWKALGYGTTNNAKDDYGFYYVAVLGPGEITGCHGTNASIDGHTVKYKDANNMDVTLKAAKFEFDDLAWLIPALDPTAVEIWQWETSKFSIDVKGMDKTSRIIFIAGPQSIDNFEDPDGKNCRMFLDDFKVVAN